MRILLPILFLAFLISSLGSVLAQTDSLATYSTYPGATGSLLLGQDHHYSVTFRGNGEALVTLKTIFTNNTKESIKTASLRVPQVSPLDISVFQVIRERRCMRYQEGTPTPIPLLEQGKPVEPSQILPCLEYEEPDFAGYWSGSTRYRKAQYTLSGDTIEVQIPQEIKTNSSGSLIFYYRALGMTKKNNFDAFDFSFETAKVNDRVDNLQVGISVDSDLYLRGAKGKVNYRFNEEFANLKVPAADSTAGVASSQFDSFYSQIGGGDIYKTASGLQPLESYTVKGQYADSRLKLYGKEIAVILILLLLIIVFVGLLVKWILNKVRQSSVSEITNSQLPASVLRNISPTIKSIIVVKLVSFLSAVLILAVALLEVFVPQWLEPWFGLYLYGTWGFLLLIIFLIFSVAVYAFLFFFPAILIGMKKGLWWGMATFVATIAWLVFFVVITFAALFMFGRSSSFYPPNDVYPSSENPLSE